MDERTQLQAERDRLEADLLALEQQRLRLVSEAKDGPEPAEALLSQLRAVNEQLAQMRR